MPDLGDRLAVIGVSGAGKSILALHLKDKLQIPIYHMDQFSWKNGWNAPQSNDAILDYVENILKGDKWLIEGYLGCAALPDLRLQRATSVIVLDYSRLRLAWHILKRHIFYHHKKRVEMPDGCYETFDLDTVKWIISILYTKKDLRTNLHNWMRYVEADKLIVFKSPAQLKIWLKDNNL